jgi:hypothetical protein
MEGDAKMDRGRRILYDTAMGGIIMDTGEVSGDVLPHEEIQGQIEVLDLPYGFESDKFMRAKRYHVDPETKAVIFDELSEPQLSYEELQQQLLIAQGVI